MIKLFVLDVDGCITMPFQIPEWEALAEIRRLNDLSHSDEAIPPVTICSGRPHPYVEAVGQWLGMYKPLIFESGGGMYNPVEVSIHWPDVLTQQREEEIAEIRAWVKRDILASHEGAVTEFSKRTDVGVVHKDEAMIIKMYDQVKPRIEAEHPGFEVHRTEISINIIMSDANKGSAFRWLAELCGLPLHEMAYIGDSTGDLPALEQAGMKFTPANGIDALKQLPDVITTKSSSTRAVAEAYEIIIAKNRTEL